MRRYLSFGMVLVLIFYTLTAAFAQESKEEFKERLTKIRNERALMKFEYDKEQAEMNKASEEKLSKIKEEFRKSRDECLREKRDRSEALRRDYETKLKPMLKEEQELIGLVGIDSETDFAKSSLERIRSK